MVAGGSALFASSPADASSKKSTASAWSDSSNRTLGIDPKPGLDPLSFSYVGRPSSPTGPAIGRCNRGQPRLSGSPPLRPSAIESRSIPQSQSMPAPIHSLSNRSATALAPTPVAIARHRSVCTAHQSPCCLREFAHVAVSSTAADTLPIPVPRVPCITSRAIRTSIHAAAMASWRAASCPYTASASTACSIATATLARFASSRPLPPDDSSRAAAAATRPAARITSVEAIPDSGMFTTCAGRSNWYATDRHPSAASAHARRNSRDLIPNAERNATANIASSSIGTPIAA